MIGFGELFKIFVIIIVIFLTLLMLIYICKKARGVFTNEYTKRQEYARTEQTRKHERSLKDRENAMKVFNRTADSLDNSINTVGKETVNAVHDIGKAAVMA